MDYRDRNDVKHGAKRATQQAVQRLQENYKSLTGNIDNKINAAKPGLFARISSRVHQYRATWPTRFSVRSPPLL